MKRILCLLSALHPIKPILAASYKVALLIAKQVMLRKQRTLNDNFPNVALSGSIWNLKHFCSCGTEASNCDPAGEVVKSLNGYVPKRESFQHGWYSHSHLVLRQQMSMINASMKSSKFIRARFNSIQHESGTCYGEAMHFLN